MVHAPIDIGHGFEDGLSVRALLSSIRRHLVLVSTLSLLLCAVGAVVGLGLPSWFQAETVLIINARPQRIADVQEQPDPIPDRAVMRSEVDMLQSRSVIEPVVRSFQLWKLPEFQNWEYPRGWTWQNVGPHFRELLGIDGGTKDGSDEPSPVTAQSDDAVAPTQAQVDDAIGKYGRYLLVGTDGNSVTIRVSYRA